MEGQWRGISLVSIKAIFHFRTMIWNLLQKKRLIKEPLSLRTSATLEHVRKMCFMFRQYDSFGDTQLDIYIYIYMDGSELNKSS